MTALIKYETACRSLAEAHSVDEVKDIRDKAEAMRVYAIQSKNVDLETMASDIRVRGERRLGELLIEAKKDGRLRPGQPEKNRADKEPFSRIRLRELGIDKKLSIRAQKLGGIAERAFEAMVTRMREDIQKRGSRAALSSLSTEEKQERRDNRERVLGACQMALPEQKFGVILADPEWRFEPWSRETGMDRAADNHYPTSVTEVIAARDVASIAADDCVLFLWATVPMLAEAFCVLDAWGFARFERNPQTGYLTLDKRAGRYVSSGSWTKYKQGAGIGMGHWFRVDHEILLVATRGNVPAPAKGAQARSVFDAPASRVHSQKPELVHEIIEGYFRTLPKIELNRRGPARPGWSAWGFEAESEPSPHDPLAREIHEPSGTDDPGPVRSSATQAFEIPDLPASLRRGPDGKAPFMCKRAGL